MIPKPAFLQPKEPTTEQFKNQPNNGANMKHHHYFKKFSGPRGFHGGAANRNRGGGRFNDRSNANNGEIRCNFKGCKFSGPPDVVKFHSDIQHLELRNKYNVDFTLNTPEDIAKWRAERKARFPTVENVEKREVELPKKNHQEEHARGGVGGARNRQHPAWRNANNNNRDHRNKRKFTNNHLSQQQHYDNNNFNIKRNRVEEDILSNKVDELERHQSDARTSSGEERKQLPSTETETVSTKSNSLNLLSYYDSDDEVDTLQQPLSAEDQSTEQMPSPPVDLTRNEDIEHAVRDLMGNLLWQVERRNVPNKRREPAGNDAVKPSTSRQQEKKPKRPASGPPLNFSRLTLFQKLMLQDVRKVKPDLIECLQLIVENNFLQSGL